VNRVVDFFTLFTSVSTLICCALPALLVTLGLGAAMAGFLGEYPELIWFSENKLSLFIVAGLLISVSGFLQWKNRNAPCPVGPKGEACARTRKLSRVIYFISLGVYLTGLSFAYILPYI